MNTQNEVEVGQHYPGRRNPDQIVTVTRVWQSEDSDEAAVAYDIWEPGYQGAPGSWGSACSLTVFQYRYNTESGF